MSAFRPITLKTKNGLLHTSHPRLNLQMHHVAKLVLSLLPMVNAHYWMKGGDSLSPSDRLRAETKTYWHLYAPSNDGLQTFHLPNPFLWVQMKLDRDIIKAASPMAINRKDVLNAI
ncbi:hypothetical protein HRE53_10930 [Acaryochloris sp. 'Moss Beach']|uniref:hypothetical protein n=1 Tax=Acaryochloris sp. 'Moss Beach' TaxID=2740837 RepID=UPI001F214984|nr:hypothetical protein [Acaryochloris sp. 'Moss Beach']UJB71437.1 hypothetical protein HRE53_10930 [Acaryochloris sp. 'Moss Beach']